MSITYCGLYRKDDHILLAESTKSCSFSHKIEKQFDSINNDSDSQGSIQIDETNIATFYKTKKLVFLCVSLDGDGIDYPQRFIQERFIAVVIQEFHGILDNVLVFDSNFKHNHGKLIHQSQLSSIFNKIIEETHNRIYENRKQIKGIDKDMKDIKKVMNANIQKIIKEGDNLEQLLNKSEKINVEATLMEENARKLERESRCIKPWMYILGIVIVILLLVYIISSLVRCGSLNILCYAAGE